MKSFPKGSVLSEKNPKALARKNLLIVLPAFNEGEKIKEVIKTLPFKIPGIKKIENLVIDDGSTDDTAKQAASKNTTVLRHIINRGLGGAIGTGFDYAKMSNADIVITFDSDGQHRPQDIEGLIKPILDGKADVVIGSRFIRKPEVPIDRIIINFLSNIATLILFGIWTSDSQSGLRAFSKKAIERIEIRTQKMEVSSEIFKEIKRNNLRFAEIPIRAIYTEYSRRKGQKNSNAIPTFYKLFLRLVR